MRYLLCRLLGDHGGGPPEIRASKDLAGRRMACGRCGRVLTIYVPPE
jgi:hypothetical protein